ncbi:MAG: Gfo/Idh/MocA family oxidoreductase [Kiritimatiellae bacterium]|nr:Gfo/Idh/MocA family oxidoreductase [Kiritimatiellia bacterium]
MQNRREFMKGSSVFAAMMAAAPTIVVGQGAAKIFKVGMIGAGGRCTGATDNLIEAAKSLGHEIKVVAVCDFFEDKAKGAAKKFGCDEKMAFGGADSYKKVVGTDCEIIVTATPPAFRPLHVEAAIKAGKHVFSEKPVAVDGPGVRRFLAAAAEAKAKNLSLVAGTQRRHHAAYLKQAKALADGKVGPVVGGAVYWNGTVPFVRRRREGMGNAAYLCDNWVNWTEMSGDHIVEQHVHNLDIANWFIGRYPRMATGFGGRARRVSGNQYDFFSVDYDYGEGVHIHSMCRQMAGCSDFVGERLRTIDGEISGGGKITKGGQDVALDGDFLDGNPYVVEHVHLLKGMLNGAVVNEGENVAMSTATAIIGRISAYTGRTIRMSDILENKDSEFYNMACQPTAEAFDAGEVELPAENTAPVPGIVDKRFA